MLNYPIIYESDTMQCTMVWCSVGNFAELTTPLGSHYYVTLTLHVTKKPTKSKCSSNSEASTMGNSFRHVT